MLDFISNNAGLLVGGTGGGIVLYVLKKIPNKEICAWVEGICFAAGRFMTLGLSQWKFTKNIWNKTVEPFFIDLIDNFVGDLIIQQRTDDGDIIFSSDDGSGGTTEYFRLDGGIELNVVSKTMLFTDNVRADFGSSNDLRLQHSSGNNSSYIQNYTGDLYIENTKTSLK